MSDTGKVLVSDGMGGWVLSSTLKVDPASGQLINSMSDGNKSAFYASTNNVAALGQADKMGVEQTIVYIGGDDNASFGGTDGVINWLAWNGINTVIYDNRWDGSTGLLPDALAIKPLNHGHDGISLTQDGSLTFTTKAVAAGDGFQVTAKNSYTFPHNYPSMLTMWANMPSDSNIDMRLGLTSADDTKRIYFRLSGTPGSHATMSCNIVNGGSPASISTGWNLSVANRPYIIRPWPNNGIVTFLAGDLNGEPYELGRFATSHAAMPSASEKLYPFFSLQSYSVAEAKQMIWSRLRFAR